MKHVKPFIINENMSNKELLDDLKGATNIIISLTDEGDWGVIYHKDGQRREGGNFNSTAEVHNFLIDNDIEYTGKEGFLMMKRYRDKQIAKVPYQSYQRELINKGLDDRFDID